MSSFFRRYSNSLFAGALLFIATLIAYAPALNGTLLWDDDGHVTKPALRSLDGLWRIWFDPGATQQYYPLLHSAFWLEHKVWGDAVLGYHLTNILLHAVAALLVVAIMRRLALPGAWLAGFIFALHPISVEAVAWISEQKSTLSAVFYLSSALTYLYFDPTRKRSQYILALGLFVLALLSKTVTATLPAALLVVIWWQRGRIGRKRDLLPLLPWLAIGTAAGIFTAWIERTYIGAQGADFSLTLLQRFMLAGRVIWFYIGKLVWPANLMFFYPHWTVDATVWWQYLFSLGVPALAAGLLWIAKRHRAPLAAFLFFTGTLFPVLGFLNVYPFVYSYVADHFVYLASLGIIVPLSVALTHLLSRDREGVGRACATAMIALLAILTWREARSYKDVETLYRDTLARNPDSWISHNNLGNYLLVTKARIPEAIEQFHITLKLKPDSAEAHNNLGSSYSRLPGRLQDAISEYEAAIHIRPNFPEAQSNLGGALAKLPGRSPEALPHLEEAVRMKPDYADAHTNLGIALSNIPGRMPDAIAEYQTALNLDPNSTQAHNNLANALAENPARLNDAISEYEAALRADPGSAEARTNLGNVLSQAGRVPEALAQFQAALRINPSSPQAHNGLGLALAKTPGRESEAMPEYRAALQLNPDFGEAHNNIGAALARAGRMKEALAHFEIAVRSTPDSAEARVNLGNALSEVPGRLPEAITQFEEAVRLKPDFAEAHYFLGLALARIPGRSAAALAEFEAALRIKPDPEIQELVDKIRQSKPSGAR